MSATTTPEIDGFLARFSAAGLPVPGIAFAAERVQVVSEWHATDRHEPLAPYHLDSYVDEFTSGEVVGDYVTLAHAGQGVASWAVTYCAVRGDVGVFIQSAWGAADDDEATSASHVARMRERFHRADELFSAAAAQPPAARLAVVDSDFGNRGWASFNGPDDLEWIRSATPIDDAAGFLSQG